MISTILIQTSDKHTADMAALVGVSFCVFLIALTIAVSCVHYYKGVKHEETLQEQEKTKQEQMRAEARTAEAAERQVNGPTGDDWVKRADSQEKIASAIAKQNENYRAQTKVIQAVIDAENARREMFGVK